MPSGFRLGRLAGIEVYVDWSLLLIFSLVVFSLGGVQFPLWHPDWSAGLIWATAVAAALLFFASVLAHELSHALVGRKFGIQIKRITLFIFGGMAHMEGEPPNWKAELWMAAVGPVTSILLGIGFLALAGLAAAGLPLDVADPTPTLRALGPTATLLLWLGPINIFLGLFNLVPGFPLDGGRVLRALLWGLTRDLHKSTVWAARSGRVFAWLLMAAGLSLVLGAELPVFGRGALNGLWLTFIGWFLHNIAWLAEKQSTMRESLADVVVAQVMRPDVAAVPPDLALDELIDRYLQPTDQTAFPVVGATGRLLGLVSMDDLRKVAREAWPQTTVAQVMTPAHVLAQLTPGQDAATAMLTLGQRGVDQLPVMENGVLRGLLRREDIIKWLSLHLPNGGGGPRLRPS